MHQYSYVTGLLGVSLDAGSCCEGMGDHMGWWGLGWFLWFLVVLVVAVVIVVAVVRLASQPSRSSEEELHRLRMEVSRLSGEVERLRREKAGD